MATLFDEFSQFKLLFFLLKCVCDLYFKINIIMFCRATHFEGLDKQANDMNIRLEEIQKSLDMYLETKKVIFPRFYFISNDDLLEILGQSKNPPAIQSQFKKLFDNIKSQANTRHPACS